MLKIRLQRVGMKNRPTFRVVVLNSRRSSKSGSIIEILGWRDPRMHTQEINRERVLYWISKGAQTSASLHNLLISEKIIKGKKIDVSPKIKVAEGGSQEGESKKEKESEINVPEERDEDKSVSAEDALPANLAANDTSDRESVQSGEKTENEVKKEEGEKTEEKKEGEK